MTSSIGYALGIGSGIDIKALVDGLAAAARDPKEALIVRREESNQAKLSALSEISSAIDFFASSLSTLIGGGSLFSQPSVSAPELMSAAAVPGARIGDLSAQIEILQIAQAQTVHSVRLGDRGDPVGQGTLTLATARGSFEVVVDASNDSLDGLAKAINDAKAGVTASVLTDAHGARLMIKSATGEAQAFTLSVADGTSSGIERFAFGDGVTGGMTLAQSAQDALLKLDGIEVSRASNSFSDLIPGVQIDLKKAQAGTTVSLGATRPTAAIEQAVGDFVAVYNELLAVISEKTAAGGAAGASGPLRGDIGVRDMQRQLAQLSTMTLVSQGSGPKTLAEIGVRTNRDGTLSLDEARLKSLLASDPEGVEALFNPSQHSSSPFVTIKSAVGRVKPGVYQVTDIIAGDPASGKIDGVAAISSGPNLVGPASSAAVGLILGIAPGATSATISIDPGLGGALQSIRDTLRARNGPFAVTQERLSKESRAIADDREAMERRADNYYNQLLNTFTSMERQVSAFKATQSYLDQQIKMWTADRN